MLTLTYFDFPGRGEAARLALHIAGADWKDDRFRGDWPAIKAQTPFGGLPQLTVDDKGSLSQSNAILNYIGRRYGLLPEDAFEAARHDALMNAVESLRAEAATTARPDEDEKKAAREAFVAGYFAKWATDTCSEIRGPFVSGASLGVADLKLFVAMRAYQKGVFDYVPATVLDPYPKLVALIEAVAAHPRVVDWYARSTSNA